MNRTPTCTAIALSLVVAILPVAPTTWAAEATEPFRGYVSAGAGYEDNLFRLRDSDEAQASIGTDQLDDWYATASAGFSSQFPGDGQRFVVTGEINHRTYDRFDFLDYTGGQLTATGEWEIADGATTSLGYGYLRELQSFTNRATTERDILQRHGIDAAIEKPLAERWQIRGAIGAADFHFSNSELLEKRQYDGEAELQYAASQQSIFGLLGTYTVSDFDENDARDSSGWSLGPSFTWQATSSFQVRSTVGYTHRGLDESGDLDDYDGVTGFVAGRWAPGRDFSGEVRVFRDVSNLGGEISEYAERTGLRVAPRWQLTPKLAARVGLTFEQRDFSTIETAAVDREDDYLLADAQLDFQVSRRLLLMVLYGYEQRDSNVDAQEFDAYLLRAGITWEI